MDLTESEIRLKDDMETELGFIVNNPNILDGDETPLMSVNMFYDNPINYTKLLIKMGANPNIINPELGTAFTYAVSNNNTDTLKYLLSVGANPLIKDGDGETPYD